MSPSKTLILLSSLQVISYKNVVLTKQIHFLYTFLKLWVHISDNIAGAESHNTAREGVGIWKGKAIFSHVQ